MLARSVLRSAAPLRQTFRSYATDAPSKSSATPYIVGAVAVGAGVLGYSFLGNSKVSAEASKPAAEEKAKSDAPASKTFTGGEQGFIDLKLKDVRKYNHNTKKFIFELPEGQVSGLNIASAIITKFKPEDAEKPVIRPYTPVSDEAEPGHLDLLVKVYPNGAMSEHLHAMKPGQTLSFKGPIPKYPWQANKHKHITLISGGTGITPMYQLARKILQNPDDKTKVSLIFGNLSESDILLKEEFEQFEKDHSQQFRAWYLVDKASDSWPHGKGHVTKELLKEVLPDPKSENIKIFVCGPPGMYKAISGAKTSPQDQGELTGLLKELGYTKEQVFKF